MVIIGDQLGWRVTITEMGVFITVDTQINLIIWNKKDNQIGKMIENAGWNWKIDSKLSWINV